MNEVARPSQHEALAVERELSASDGVVVTSIEFPKRPIELKPAPELGEPSPPQGLSVDAHTSAPSANIIDFPRPADVSEIEDNEAQVTSQVSNGLSAAKPVAIGSARPTSRTGRLEATLGRAA